MDVDQIKIRLSQIEQVADDHEAHVMQDVLYKDFITFVAQTAPSPLSGMAAEVLKVSEIDFCRWYS